MSISAADFQRIEPPAQTLVISPDDDNDIADGLIRALLITATGTLRITDGDGNVVNIPDGALAASTQYVMQVKRIHDTGTTATGFVGWR